MKPTKRTIAAVVAAAAALIAVPLVASATSNSSETPNEVLDGGHHSADVMQAHDGMMTGGTMDHDTMMTDGTMNHDTMMTDGTMDHDGMITDGTMNNEMPQRGITPGDAGGHAGHHPDGSPQSVGS